MRKDLLVVRTNAAANFEAAKHCAALHLTGGLGGSQSPCLGMVPPLWSSKVTCLAETGRHEEA